MSSFSMARARSWLTSIKRSAGPGAVATAWTLTGHVLRQSFRLAGNLVLTRLLVPEAFGLAAIVTMVLQGLALISDLGTRASVIQSKRGEDQPFLDTAWSMQVVRGIGLNLACIAVAWPVAKFYGDDRLVGMMCIIGIGAAISGTTPTSFYVLWRNLDQRRTTLIELVGQFLTLIFIVALAYLMRSPWALVIGTTVGQLITRITVAWATPGPRNRWHIDRAALSEIMNFGRWITLSSALTFVTSQGDRLLLGKLLTLSDLGVYSVAFFLARAIPEGVGLVVNRVLFPLYSRFGRDGSDGEIAFKIRRSRARLMALVVPPMCGLVVFGDLLVNLLYDDRYLAAGWMVRILAAGAILGIVLETGSIILLAQGDSRANFLNGLIRFLTLYAAMLIGWNLSGLSGLIIGTAIAPVIQYPYMVYQLRRYKVWDPKLDSATMLFASVAVGLLLAGRYLI
jgi:O-antigen/teichoic acid export membrane protein